MGASSMLVTDFASLRAQLAVIFQEFLVQAQEAFANGASKTEPGINDLRQQIIANSKILVPVAIHNVITAPEIEVITVGKKPAIRAMLFMGGESPKKVFEADADATTAGALGNLLKLTQELLTLYVDFVGNHNGHAHHHHTTAPGEDFWGGTTFVEQGTRAQPTHNVGARTNQPASLFKGYWNSDVTNDAFKDSDSTSNDIYWGTGTYHDFVSGDIRSHAGGIH